jgi:dTDP-4-dehydrorhamnose 3,5-epimerase
MEPIEDDRGHFARTWCAEEFAAHGIVAQPAQCSVSFNCRRGTLRGMHYQAAPHAEAKLVRCSRGAIYDVLLDLRPDSPTYCQWLGLTLTAADGHMVWLPEGLAHGFQTLVDEAEIFYQISTPYHPESARGVRWNDPAFGIEWPMERPILSARDAGICDFVRQVS